MPPLVLAALAMGIFGSAHCLAMCGGIAGVLSGGIAPNLRRRPPTHIAYVVLYNLGRLSSYALMGAAFGFAALGLRQQIAHAQVVMRIAAGALVLGLGLYLAGVLPAFARIERIGAPVWKKLAPRAGALLPVRSPVQALLLGALWGWVPCGMVYAALALATSADGPLEAAAAMTAFGLGTLPAMVGVGTVAGQVQASLGRAWVRRGAGLVLVGFALVSLAFAGSALAAAPAAGEAQGAQGMVCGGHGP